MIASEESKMGGECCHKPCKSRFFCFLFYFLSVHDRLYRCSHPNFFPFAPLHLVHPFPSAIPSSWFTSMGHACKFFGFSLSYIFSYQLCFLISVLFCPFSPFSLPPDNAPNDPHSHDSVHVLVVCLV